MLGMIVSAQYAIYASVAEEPVVQAALLRLRPSLIWFSLVCVQIIIVLVSWHYDILGFRAENRSRYVPALVVLGSFIMLWIFLAVTGYGFGFESVETGFFRAPGPPILGTQIFISLVAALLSVRLWRWAGTKFHWNWIEHSVRKDLVIGLLLWIVTCIAWMSVPIQPNWFADPPRAPNYTFSPNSDALIYDTVAQSVIVGAGFENHTWGDQVRKPMLAALLAGLHLVGGLGYEKIIWLQVGLLAIFSPLVYFITKMLDSRSSGILAALLIIFRERNAIILADTITVSHAKVLMSDLPAAIGVTMFLILAILWLKKPMQRGVLAMLSGGVLGFFALIRIEIIVIMIPVSLVSLWMLRRNLRSWLLGLGALTLGLMLMFSPWVIRNLIVTQVLYLDADISPLIENFISSKGIRSDYEVGVNTFGGYKDALMAKRTVYSQDMVEAHVLANNDKDAISGVENFLDHYFNGQIQMVLFLSMKPQVLETLADAILMGDPFESWATCCSVKPYVRSLPYWWSDWDGKLAPQSNIPMVLVLIVISFGFVVLWRRQKILGLLPTLGGIVSLLFFAMLNRSGGRWIVEFDWVSTMVYGIGLSNLVHRAANWAGGGSHKYLVELDDRRDLLRGRETGKGMYGAIGVLILLIGSILLVFEFAIPQRYSMAELEDLVEDNLLVPGISQLAPNELTILEDLLSENDLLSDKEVLVFESTPAGDLGLSYGRALYPRYYRGSDGMDGKQDAFKLPFSRIEFSMVGLQNELAVLPFDRESVNFPHAADVIVVGCKNEAYVEVVALIVDPLDENGQHEFIWMSPLDSEYLGCANQFQK